MVIAPGRDGIGFFVLLGDDEFIPERFNRENVLVMRRGDSTNREVLIVKNIGEIAGPELLRSEPEPVCNYQDGGPLHQHADGTWWFYENTWTLERGPFETEAIGYAELQAYCEEYLQSQQPEETEED